MRLTRSELKEVILEVYSEVLNEKKYKFYQPKINKDRISIKFINTAEFKQAQDLFRKKKINIDKATLDTNTIKFLNHAEFKKAENLVMNEETYNKTTKTS